MASSMQEIGHKAGEQLDRAKAWFLSKIKGDEPSDPFSNCLGCIDAKTPLTVRKYGEKIVIYSQNKKLNLKNSPPFLQGIMLDTMELIQTIFVKNPIDQLKGSLYLSVFVTKFEQHSKKTIKLFKDAKEQMEDEKSAARRELNKHTLLFSHMLSELKVMYNPDGAPKTDFKLVKQEARDFWENAFGRTLIVTWDEFLVEFEKVHKLCSVEEGRALKSTMDLMENNHISWFEFDIFTRLFQPWKQLLNNWNVIVIRHPGYQAFMTYDEVEAILTKFLDKPGSYVFRLSCTRLGQWAIGFVTPNRTIVQTIPQSKSLYQALIDGAEDKSYIYPCGQNFNPDIRQQIRVAPEEHIKVTREQYDIYCDIDSTFEMCKICNNNVKSVKMDPCGHLMCKQCLQKWIEKGSGKAGEATCPWCREPILSTESVKVEPFNPFEDEELDDAKEVLPELPSFNPFASGDAPSDTRRQSWSASQMKRPGAASQPLPPPPAGPARITKSMSVDEGAAAVVPVPSPPLPPRRAHTGGSSSPVMGAPAPSPPLPHRPASPRAMARSDSISGPSEQHVKRLMDMGFPRESVLKALRVARNDIAVASDILLQFS